MEEHAVNNDTAIAMEVKGSIHVRDFTIAAGAERDRAFSKHLLSGLSLSPFSLSAGSTVALAAARNAFCRWISSNAAFPNVLG